MGGRPLRVCLDARLPDGVAGGVQQTVIGLASGLSQTAGPDEEDFFLAFRDSHEWLAPYLGRNARLLLCERPASSRGLVSKARAALPILDRLAFEAAALLPLRAPRSDGTVERAGVDVMHFTLQQGFVTELPSIYVPHDLQHRHYPEFFSRFDLKWREAVYPTLAHRARRVVALSRWGKRDLVEQLRLAEDRIHVIGWAPALDVYPEPTPSDVRAVRERLRLPEAFALYPAQTLRHKNHQRLLEALAALRDAQGVRVPLVCSGARADALAPEIARELERLRLEDSVRFVGFVSPLELRALYALARLLVFPSLFEGFGMPVVEAFRAGVPVACSSVTSLGELTGDAALQFDPTRVEEIASAVARLWTDPALRDDLARRGRDRVAGVTWAGVARAYRALHRLVGGRELGAEDRAILESTR